MKYNFLAIDVCTENVFILDRSHIIHMTETSDKKKPLWEEK